MVKRTGTGVNACPVIIRHPGELFALGTIVAELSGQNRGIDKMSKKYYCINEVVQ